MFIWRRSTCFTSTFVCSSSGVKQLPKIALTGLVLVAACPGRDAKRASTTASDSNATVDASVATGLIDAEIAPNAGLALGAAAPQVVCDAGLDCTTRGKQAFDARHYLEAHQLFERACELKDALGCKWLALDSKDVNDPRIPVDEARVAPLLEKACELGAADACWLLGNGYLYGNRSGVIAADPERAVGLYQKGCDGGDAGSCS